LAPWLLEALSGTASRDHAQAPPFLSCHPSRPEFGLRRGRTQTEDLLRPHRATVSRGLFWCRAPGPRLHPTSGLLWCRALSDPPYRPLSTPRPGRLGRAGSRPRGPLQGYSSVVYPVGTPPARHGDTQETEPFLMPRSRRTAGRPCAGRNLRCPVSLQLSGHRRRWEWLRRGAGSGGRGRECGSCSIASVSREPTAFDSNPGGSGAGVSERRTAI